MRYNELLKESQDDYPKLVELISDWLEGSGKYMSTAELKLILDSQLAKECKPHETGNIYRAVNLPRKQATQLLRKGEVHMKAINNRPFVAYSFDVNLAYQAAVDYDVPDSFRVIMSRTMEGSDLVLDLTLMIKKLAELGHPISNYGREEHEVWVVADEFFTTAYMDDLEGDELSQLQEFVNR